MDEIKKSKQHLNDMAELLDLMNQTEVRKAIALYRKLYKVIET